MLPVLASIKPPALEEKLLRTG